MALPKVEVPTYELTLPSRDERIGFRPFTVKEEKVLMIAAESEDENEIFKGSERGLNIDLPFICDLQYFFTHGASIQSSTFNSEWFDRIKLWKTTKYDTH